MSERENLAEDFLENTEFAGANRKAIAGDASFRHYFRLFKGDKTAILMDAPPSRENIEPFINIDNYLRKRNFSAPEIYAIDRENGFLLLEDFGDNSFTNVLSGNSPLSSQYSELELYIAATDTLIELNRATLPKNEPEYETGLLLKECKLFTDWYLPHFSNCLNIEKAKQEYEKIWTKLFDLSKFPKDSVVLRDYHADNLMWLPQREGVAKVGLLDFQDAVIGSPIYDLISLLEDARRDISLKTKNAVIEHYVTKRKTIDMESFKQAYDVLSAQRDCKILGIFARLSVRDKKPKYLKYLPRVWQGLHENLKNPVLLELKIWLDSVTDNEITSNEYEYFTKKNLEKIA